MYLKQFFISPVRQWIADYKKASDARKEDKAFHSIATGMTKAFNQHVATLSDILQRAETLDYVQFNRERQTAVWVLENTKQRILQKSDGRWSVRHTNAVLSSLGQSPTDFRAKQLYDLVL